MSEVFTLRQHLENTRQELSQALYQYDASCRVIARLMIERDEARAMHMKETGYVPSAQGSVNPSVLPSDGVPMEHSMGVSEGTGSVTESATTVGLSYCHYYIVHTVIVQYSARLAYIYIYVIFVSIQLLLTLLTHTITPKPPNTYVCRTGWRLQSTCW